MGLENKGSWERGRWGKGPAPRDFRHACRNIRGPRQSCLPDHAESSCRAPPPEGGGARPRDPALFGHAERARAGRTVPHSVQGEKGELCHAHAPATAACDVVGTNEDEHAIVAPCHTSEQL